MVSEVEKANAEVRKLYGEKLNNDIKTSIEICRDEYATKMNNSNWRTYIETLKDIDKENNICTKCGNKPLFNPLAVCSKCSNRYDNNGNIIKEPEEC